jgi:succinate dehydrogenase subunit D
MRRGADPSEGASLGDILDWSDARQVRPAERRPRPRGPQARAEALAWALFSAGGFVAAVLLPVHAAILGIAFAAGWLPDRALSYQRILHLAQSPITKLYLLALISLPLYHWAHRFRFALHHQFGIHWRRLVAVGCYGTAVAGTGLTIWVLLRI